MMDALTGRQTGAQPPRSGGFPDVLAVAAEICRGSVTPAAVLCRGGDDWQFLGNAALGRLLGAEGMGAEGGGGDFLPAATVLPHRWAALRFPAEEAWRGGPVAVSLAGIAYRLAPLRNGPRVVALFLSAAAESLQAAQEAAQAAALRADQQKSRFFAAASHDLRQPFQAMRLFMSALQSHLKEARSRQIAEKLSQSLEAGEALLNSFLDVSILDGGGITPKPEAVDLAGLVARVAEEVRGQAEAKGLRLRLVLRPAQVTADPVLLSRILRNFLTNAVHYTRRGGILAGIRHHGGRAVVQVWDTGFGISREDLGRIFEEFYQIENPERDRKRGLGLGLSIVKRLADLLGASLDVRSCLGRGSVFSVALPLAAQLPAAERPGDGPALCLAGRMVMVVDDDELVLSALQVALEGLGCEVLAAGDMAAVFRAVDQLPGGPEAMVCDLRLRGGLSGFQVIDRVRSLFRRPVPAIVLTGEAGGAEMLAEAERRALRLMRKPVDIAALAASLQELLER